MNISVSNNDIRVPTLDFPNDSSLPDIKAFIAEDLARLYKEIQKDPILSLVYPDQASFTKAVHDTYEIEGRSYHGIEHVIYMQKQTLWVKAQMADLSDAFAAHHGSKLSEAEHQWAANVKRTAAIAHDMAYVNIDGKVTDYNMNAMPYIASLTADPQTGTAKATLAGTEAFEKDDVARMVNKVFGYTPGQEINQSTGLNEYLSAMSIAKHTETTIAQHGSMTPEVFEYITAVTVAIAATVPFRDQAAYDQFCERARQVYHEFPQLETAAAEHGGIARRSDLVNGVATILANQDVLSFCGEVLERNTDVTWRHNDLRARGDDAAATRQLADQLQRDIVLTHNAMGPPSDLTVSAAAAEALRFEETPEAIKARKEPGDCTVAQFQHAAWKRSRVCVVAEGKLYHTAPIGTGDSASTFPPTGVVKAMNLSAFDPDTKQGVMDTLAVSNNAHNSAIALLRAISDQKGMSNDKLKDMTARFDRDALLEATKDHKLKTFDPRAQAALSVLANRPHRLNHDLKQSPIAMALLQVLTPDEAQTMYRIAEIAYGAPVKLFTGDILPEVTRGGKAETFMDGLEKSGLKPKVQGIINYLGSQLDKPVPPPVRNRVA